MKYFLGLFLFVVFFKTSVFSQTDSIKNNLPNIYLDCSDCDSEYMNYIKKNLNFVNYVRERRNADLHIIVTENETGSGGDQINLLFYGQNRFKGVNDTLYFSVLPNTSDEVMKKKFVKVLKIGIIKYLTNTNLIDNVKINYNLDTISKQVNENEDKWKSWVFKLASHFWYNGESSYTNLNIEDHVSAIKITDKFKQEIYIGQSYNESHYLYDGDEIIGTNNNYWFSDKTVFSINDHWSYGFTSNINSSTYSNINVSANLLPAIEYDVFPYSKSTIKQFRILYRIGPVYNNYIDTTVFGKTTEVLYRNTLTIGYATNKKWGTIDLRLISGAYLHDFSLNREDVVSDISINLFKGLSFYLSGQLSFIHDQVSLSKEEASLENVLIRTKQLPTTLSYYTRIGLTYTFGSIYNNVVNPRFND